MSTWEQLGEIATVAQLTGHNAVRLISMILEAASTARMPKKICKQFAHHLKLIGNLLEQLKISELKKYPETREPLEQLEDALRRSYILVNSCQDRSYLYLLAMGWNIVYQFRKAQNEIDRYLKLVPFITLVDNAGIRERLEAIQEDQREYTLDEENRRVQDIILKPNPCRDQTSVWKKTLSCSYPNLGFNEALQQENEKLKLQLQWSQAHLDVNQCEVIQHLIDATEAAATNSLPEKSSPVKGSKKLESNYADVRERNNFVVEAYPKKTESRTMSKKMSSASPGSELQCRRGFHHNYEEWHTDLLSCCSEPYLSPAQAFNEIMAYLLILSCYTRCMRRKLRKVLNITGGFIDDFLSHVMCCCCALVQEWRDVEIRGVTGRVNRKQIQIRGGNR